MGATMKRWGAVVAMECIVYFFFFFSSRDGASPSFLLCGPDPFSFRLDFFMDRIIPYDAHRRTNNERETRSPRRKGHVREKFELFYSRQHNHLKPELQKTMLPVVAVKESNAASIMEILFERGDVESVSNKDIKTHSPPASCFVATHDNTSFCTIDTLVQDFAQLVFQEGRMELVEAAHRLGVHTETLQQHVIHRTKQMTITSTEALSAQHLQGLIRTLLQNLEAESPLTPPITIHSIARAQLRLPSDLVLRAFQDELLARKHNNNNDASEFPHIRRWDDGARVLVTKSYWNWFQDQLEQQLSTTCDDQPLDVRAICQANHWSFDWTRNIILERHSSDGEWYQERYYATPAFLQQQEERVRQTIHRQGYICVDTATQQWLSRSRLQRAVLEDVVSGTVHVLPNSLVHTAMIVEPLREALENTLVMEETTLGPGWINLYGNDSNSAVLPLELLDHHPEDARLLVEQTWTKIRPTAKEDSDNDLVMCIDIPVTTTFVVFRSKFWHTFRRGQQLRDLIQSSAAAQAAERLVEETMSSSAPESVTARASAKARHRARMAAHNKNEEEATGATAACHPTGGYLDTAAVAKAVLSSHADLRVTFSDRTRCLEQVCEDVICGDDLNQACETALQAELRRLRPRPQAATTTVQQIALLHDRDTIQSAFESQQCFGNLCFLLQSYQKFLVYCNNHHDPTNNEQQLRALLFHFLHGICGDFCRRLTEYALLRNQVEDFTFHFGKRTTRPLYYSPVDLVQREELLPAISLQYDCNICPHKALRNALPSSGTGAVLSDMWKQCECRPPSEDDGEDGLHVMSQRIDAFLALVKEHTLSIAGLPFRLLDKKSEKKALTARKQQLLEAIERSDEPLRLIDLSIMFLFQQVKNLVVVVATNSTTPDVRTYLLKLLANERKAPQPQIDFLLEGIDGIPDGSVAEYVHRLRESVLSK